MITRRSFLAALACLPVIGKYVPKPEPEPSGMAVRFAKQYTIVADENPSVFSMCLCGERFQESGKDASAHHHEWLHNHNCAFKGREIGDPWPSDVVAERIKAGRPVI